MKDSICVLPWNQLSVDPQGALRLCCNSYDGTLRENGQPLKIQNYNELNKLSQSEPLMNLRQQMIRGEQPQACQRCWDMEKIGQRSFRQIQNDSFAKTYRRILKGDQNFQLEYLSLDFGNKCNLACKMCKPSSSDFLAREQSRAEEYLSPEEVGLARSTLQQGQEPPWYQNPNFWQLIRPRLKQVRRLYIIGGEPFIIPEHQQLLEELIKYAEPRHIEISYNSNLTQVPTRLLELWRNFKAVRIGASIDGVDAVYEYIRWPVRFSKIETNFKNLRDLKLSYLHLDVFCTVQNLNVANLPELIRRFDGSRIFFLPVHFPNYLHAGNLPREVIEQSYNEITQISEKRSCCRTIHEELPNLLKYLSSVLDNYHPQPDLRTRFLTAMAGYDRRRNQDLFSVHPYFKNWQ